MKSRWLLWTLLALICWGAWAILSKVIGEALSPKQNQALSTIGILPVLFALGFRRKSEATNSSRRGVTFAFAAGTLTCVGNIAYYAALNNAKALAVVPLTALYPLVTILLAVVFLRERINLIQRAGIALSIAAIYLFNISDAGGFFTSAMAVAMIPIVLWGVSGLLQKISTNHISGELSAWWFLAAFVPVAGFLLVNDPVSKAPNGRVWLLVILIGLTFALGNFALLKAFASGGKASIIAPVAGLYPMVSIPMAMLILGERASSREAIGIVVSLLAVLAISMESQPTNISEKA
jgi:uncharacterized membrane protein